MDGIIDMEVLEHQQLCVSSTEIYISHFRQLNIKLFIYTGRVCIAKCDYTVFEDTR